MESTQEQVVYFVAKDLIVVEAGTVGDLGYFQILSSRFYVKGTPAFAPGDRVRITITKEPTQVSSFPEPIITGE